jgi:predicted RNA-binding protein associated with RNAse of E/G family
MAAETNKNHAQTTYIKQKTAVMLKDGWRSELMGPNGLYALAKVFEEAGKTKKKAKVDIQIKAIEKNLGMASSSDSDDVESC